MRLIDADALIPMMKYATTDSDIGVFPIKIGFDAIVKVINAQPTIEPRKKGKWIPCESETGEGSNTYKCSACGEIQMIIDGTPKENGWAYCPHCGAKNIINNAKDIDAEPVKHAYWTVIALDCVDDLATLKCSRCGIEREVEDGYIPDYCEGCGAKMDEEKENTHD